MEKDKTHIELDGPDDTKRFGIILGMLAEPGDVIALSGDLGAGKTTLVQSIAMGAGVDSSEYVSSPSFALLHEYGGKLPLYHMDFYRISAEEVEYLGLDEYFYRSGLACVEWYENAREAIPGKSLFVDITIQNQTTRRLLLSSSDQRWHKRIEELVIRFASSADRTS